MHPVSQALKGVSGDHSQIYPFVAESGFGGHLCDLLAVADSDEYYIGVATEDALELSGGTFWVVGLFDNVLGDIVKFVQIIN